MDDRRWYEALALMTDEVSHHHSVLAGSEEAVEQRMRNRYPDAVVILVREQRGTLLTVSFEET